MMLAARGAIRSSGAGLPYDAEVEYLESTGTQWIDTGIRGAGSGYLATTFQPLNVGSSSTYWRYFGASNGDTRTERTIAYNAGGRTIFENGYNQFVLGTSRGDVYTIQKTGYNVPSGSAVGDKNFQIFGYSGTYNIGNVRFYSFSLWDSNNTLVRDYIPVRKKTVGYLYDRVTRKLFGNAGSGAFVLGPDVVPVEYIESTGTQWIDTGVPTADRYIFEWLCTDATRDVKLFGNSYAYGKYRDLSIYNSTYRGTNIATESNSWDRVEIDVTRPSLTVTRNGSAFGTASSWYAAYTRTAPETQYGTALPLGGHVNANGTWYGTNRITSFYTQYGTKLRTRLFEAWNGLDMKERLLPVRIGTEGAMMDTLTRRIYRNAGTGAFAYGNDLKYPIPA